MYISDVFALTKPSLCVLLPHEGTDLSWQIVLNMLHSQNSVIQCTFNPWPLEQQREGIAA